MPHDELLELINQDPARPWYRIEAAAKAGTKVRAKVHIMDAIGGWFGIRASDFVREVNDLDVDEIELHLNSPGGGVWDGMAIMNALRAHRAAVEVHIDGIAASIASIIAMAGDEVVMSRGSQMMIHNASMGRLRAVAQGGRHSRQERREHGRYLRREGRRRPGRLARVDGR